MHISLIFACGSGWSIFPTVIPDRLYFAIAGFIVFAGIDFFASIVNSRLRKKYLTISARDLLTRWDIVASRALLEWAEKVKCSAVWRFLFLFTCPRSHENCMRQLHIKIQIWIKMVRSRNFFLVFDEASWIYIPLYSYIRWKKICAFNKDFSSTQIHTIFIIFISYFS